MNITLLYDFLLEEGGLERVMATQARWLAEKNKVKVSFATVNQRLLYLFKDVPVGEHNWLWKNPTMRIISTFLNKNVLEESKEAELFVSHSFICTRLAHEMKERHKIPYVVYLHHPPNFLYFKGKRKEWGFDAGRKVAMAAGILFGPVLRSIDKKVVRAADKIFVNSYYTKRGVEKIYNIDAQVIYPTLSKIFRMKEKKETGYVLEKYNLKKFIFCTGRLIPDKKYEWLVEALSRLRDGDVDLVIAGRIGKAYEEALRERAIHLGCLQRIKFLGYVLDEDLVALYNEAKVFVFPAPDEDFGLVPVEAMACGCPVVAWADNAGPSETVIEGISGYLAKPYDCGDFAEKIEQVLKEDLKERKKSEIVKSVERFKEEVQMKVFVEEIEKVKKNFI
ncbi:MAG TPA: glycosyltransferase family 1 protein [Candidatus Nanoarchaeia archaeon]|nr:glycosyltransferase family 1 protein [Candidatus Nanoarchaeia archaeon]